MYLPLRLSRLPRLSSVKVIVAMGPWTCLAEDWFGIPIPMQVSLKPRPGQLIHMALVGCTFSKNEASLTRSEIGPETVIQTADLRIIMLGSG